MLIGQYTSKLTDKKRIAIPKKLREQLGERLIIAQWYEGCLVLVSFENWQRLLERLTGPAGIITEPVREIDRFVLGSAFEITTDSQGRFVVPEILLEYAKIKTEVVFVGLGDRIEVWSLENWLKVREVAQKKATEAIEKIAKEKEK